MTNSKMVNNNFIFSVFASWVMLFINLGHDNVQFVTDLFIPPFLPQRWDKGLNFYKNVCTWKFKILKFSGCAFDKASYAARSTSSFLLIYLCLGIQQNVIYLLPDNISWHVSKTLFTRGFLLSWLSMACNTDMLSENITKHFLEQTLTYFKALLTVATSVVKIL